MDFQFSGNNGNMMDRCVWHEVYYDVVLLSHVKLYDLTYDMESTSSQFKVDRTFDLIRNPFAK